MEDHEETSRGRRKPAPSSGTSAQLRPDVDIILSLKSPAYKAVMEGYFRRLGDKKNPDSSNEAEREAAREALNLFKNRKGGETPRFFKPESRYSNKAYVEVDEAAALEKITADVYRRMESAKRWMNPAAEAGDDDPSRSSPTLPQEKSHDAMPTTDEAENLTTPAATVVSFIGQPPRANAPVRHIPTKPPPPKSAKKNAKRKLLKKVPQSLPFLSNINTRVADVIVGEEVRSKKKTLSPNVWQNDEVVNFFKGLYVHGWGRWAKLSKMIKTRNNNQVKSYALKLEKKSPELRQFFSEQAHAIRRKQGARVKRDDGKSSGFVPKQPIFTSSNDPAIVAASVIGAMKHEGPERLGKPKVVICLGDHIIDTEADPSLIQPCSDRKRPPETLPDYFDQLVRPSVPSNKNQVYIPGNKVYARWLNRDDPGSYGTWYPGFIKASKVAPIQDIHNYTGVSNLLYHVRFDDGAESLDLDTEDIMMQNQYQSWLKDLEQYYDLPAPKDLSWKRLSKNARVYAKWIDPTDPELHGSWMSGKVHSSRNWIGPRNQLRHKYHVYFDNGDQDEDLKDDDVLDEETYKKLLKEKMEGGRKKAHLSGLDLITEASKIASPIKVTPVARHDTIAAGFTTKTSLNVSQSTPIFAESLFGEATKPGPHGPAYAALQPTAPPSDACNGADRVNEVLANTSDAGDENEKIDATNNSIRHNHMRDNNVDEIGMGERKRPEGKLQVMSQIFTQSNGNSNETPSQPNGSTTGQPKSVQRHQCAMSSQ